MAEVLKDFGVYVLSFLDKWFFWVGIAMLIGDLLDKYWPRFKEKIGKWVPQWAFGGLAALLFILAGFQVWHDEYTKTHGLHLAMDEWGFARGMSPRLSQKLGNGTPIIIIATIRNVGNPSIADNWSLSVDAGGRTIEPGMVDFNITDPPPITFDGDTIPMSKLLYKETETPIQSGDEKQGILIFFASRIALKDLAVKGTKLTLTCHDVAGDVIRSVATVKGNNEGHRHFYNLE